MEDLINDFIAETREMLEALSGELVAWEAAPEDRTRLDSIFRFVHTVKGNCGFLDLPRLAKLSHAAEDALAEVRSGKRKADPQLVSAVLGIVDRIGELVHALETGESVPSGDDATLIASLLGGAPDALVAAPAAQAESRKAIRSIRLSVELLDRLMSGVSDMVLARNELARRLRAAPGDLAVEAAFERVSACIAEMRDSITRTRMQRIDSLFSTLPRFVRDLASELGKQVLLNVDGGDVELDREMIEMIRDPLTHIVRNAIDHGIEHSEDRVLAGKNAAGALRVAARQSGNQILIEISDDGRGIDGDRLVKRAIAGGHLSEKQAEELSAQQKTALIFEAGLSTAETITGVSGRGVGMDVVRANVERIGGTTEIDSKLGQGTRLILRVPLTLTIIPALTVLSGGMTYAIPRSAIEEIVRSRNNSVRIELVGAARIATIRERRVPLVELGDCLGIGCGRDVSEQTIVVLKPAGGDVFALSVDGVHDHEELVIKPAAPLVMATGLYAGTTLAHDGSPILLLDPSGLASAAGLVSADADAAKRLAAPQAERVSEGTPALLFRSLDRATRAIPLAVVQRIEEVQPGAVRNAAGRLRVTLGEEILPLAGCGDLVPADAIRILRLSDGVNQIAYGFAEVLDLVQLDEALQPASTPGEVAGVTLLGGEQVEVIDAYWLFAAYTSAVPENASDRPVCAIPADDIWMNTILRPIIESAGYAVVEASSGVKADVVLASAEAPAEVLPPSEGALIRIRAAAEPSGSGDESIYRYDRAALLAALGRGQRAAGKASR